MVITKNSFKGSIIDTKPEIRIEDMNELDYWVDRLYSVIVKVSSTSPKNLRSYWDVGKILTQIDQSQNRPSSRVRIIKNLAIKLNSAFSKDIVR
ncbi:MAG: hypothetical protein H6Q69_2219 [Firmicutes bacterium]|nr:hypothetical protein [Bacillota bacterium]